ncbi:MFS transporter, partial [Streptomyces hyaluromycini]
MANGARRVTRAARQRTAEGQPLWRQRDFGFFWLAQTLSVLGDSFSLIALPLLVLQATGSVAQMGLLTGVGGAAMVLAAVFAGVVVDRADRRKLLIACDLVRMVLYGLVPLVWLAGPRLWLLYVVLPLCEAVGMLFAVGYVTVVRGPAANNDKAAYVRRPPLLITEVSTHL